MLLLLRILIQQSSFIQHRTPSSSNTRVHLHPTHSTAKYSPKLLTSWYVVLSFKLLYIRSSYWEVCNTTILSPSFTGDIIRCWSLLSLWKQALYSEDILCGIWTEWHCLRSYSISFSVMFNVINIFQLIWVSGIYTSTCTCVLVFVGTNQPFIMWVGIKDRPSLSKERACPGSLQLERLLTLSAIVVRRRDFKLLLINSLHNKCRFSFPG